MRSRIAADTGSSRARVLRHGDLQRVAERSFGTGTAIGEHSPVAAEEGIDQRGVETRLGEVQIDQLQHRIDVALRSRCRKCPALRSSMDGETLTCFPARYFWRSMTVNLPTPLVTGMRSAALAGMYEASRRAATRRPDYRR